MRSFTSTIAAVAALVPLAFAAPNQPYGTYDMNPSSYGSDRLVKTDVVVIGGGSVGTYAAIQLKDKGKKVMVIESKDRLGGHTETYIDPESGKPIDMGVKLYHNDPIVYKWYARFNLTVSPYTIAPPTRFVDFRSGKILEGLPAANATAMGLATQKYAAIMQNYPQVNDGFFLPNPVPEDLYQPFGKLVEKYNLGDAVQFIFGLGSAFGDILELPAIQQMRTMSLDLLATITNFQSSSVRDNSLLFEKAQAELLAADSVLLSSHVLSTQRVSETGDVLVLVATPTGPKLIQAKRLLIAIPPTLPSMASLDPSDEELAIFRQFTAVGYYTAIVKNLGNDSIQHLSPSSPFAMPPMPAIYSVNPAVENPALAQVFYGTRVGQFLTDEQAKAAIMADLTRYRAVNGIEGPAPEFVAFSNHSPYNMMVGVEATKNGFYGQLYGLQGKRNTYWAGATFRGHDSTSSWKFTEKFVLPGLLGGL